VWVSYNGGAEVAMPDVNANAVTGRSADTLLEAIAGSYGTYVIRMAPVDLLNQEGNDDIVTIKILDPDEVPKKPTLTALYTTQAGGWTKDLPKVKISGGGQDPTYYYRVVQTTPVYAILTDGLPGAASDGSGWIMVIDMSATPILELDFDGIFTVEVYASMNMLTSASTSLTIRRDRITPLKLAAPSVTNPAAPAIGQVGQTLVTDANGSQILKNWIRANYITMTVKAIKYSTDGINVPSEATYASAAGLTAEVDYYRDIV